MMLITTLKQTMVAARYRMPHRRQIFQYAASHPDETMVALGAAAAVTSYRIWTLELRTRVQQHALRSQEQVMKAREQSFNERERELRAASETLQHKYDAMRDDKKRMEASILERGKAGEEVLGQLLEECKSQNIVKGYNLQHEISPGKRPDAVAEIMDGFIVVIDSKAPNPPDDFGDQSRREYADKLKVHIRQLSDKLYNENSEGRLAFTLMMLPGEGYLQAAYKQGKDVFALHKFARDRNVLIVGPNGLRTLLQVVKIWLEEQAAEDRLKDAQVHGNIVTTIQPLWTESLLPFMKRLSKLLQNVVDTWNSKVDSIVALDKALRSKDVFDLARARKTQLPKRVTLPKSIDDN